MTTIPSDGNRDRVVSAWLFAINEEDFQKIVAQDARGRLDEDASAALRHPLALRRWLAAITLLLGDARTQIAEKRPRGYSIEVASHRYPEFGEWYAKLARWRQSLLYREQEARHLIAEQARLHGKNWEGGAVGAAKISEKSARKEQAAEVHAEAVASGKNGTSNKARKRVAGEVAIERLINLHLDEFARMLDEEHSTAGTSAHAREEARRLARAGLTIRAAEEFARDFWPTGPLAPGIWLVTFEAFIGDGGSRAAHRKRELAAAIAALTEKLAEIEAWEAAAPRFLEPITARKTDDA